MHHKVCEVILKRFAFSFGLTHDRFIGECYIPQMWRHPGHLHAFCSWKGEHVGRLVLVAEARIEITDLIIIREQQAYGLPALNVVHCGQGRANCTTCKCMENV